MPTTRKPDEPGGITTNANDAVAFFVEVIALVILGAWAWRLFPDSLAVRTAAVVVVVAGVASLWALFAAPKARVRSLPASVAVKALVLGASIAAVQTLWSNLTFTIVWAVIVVINTVLTYVGPYARKHQPLPPPAVID